jgi:hypothetical protein
MSTNTAITVTRGAILFIAALLVGGCIVSDELTTITIHADGSAELVKFCSNVHSNEKGDKGKAELQRFVADFNARADSDLIRVAQSGGEIVESRWIRDEPPYSALVVARMPTAAVLERFCTLRGERGETLVEGRFVQDGERRRLSLMISLSNVPESPEPKAAFLDNRQLMANGLSQFRIAVAQGSIVDARGFIVAADKQSALLASDAIDTLLREFRGHAELYLEWQVTEN